MILQTLNDPSDVDWDGLSQLKACCPNHQFVTVFERGISNQHDFNEATASCNVGDVAGQFFVNPSKQELMSLHERAGIFLHMPKSIVAQGTDRAEFPIAIAEAMATG